MDDLIGRTLKDRFRITGRLGEGSMGSVYRGVELSSGRDVAIKVMHPGLMKEPGMLTRFRREATAMRSVRHPNAVEVFAHGIDDGLVFLALELATGGDLAEHIATERRFAPERAVRIMADVLSALAEAHAHGVVHRDVKPENIMLGGAAGDTPKLIDFGIAKPTGTLAGESSIDIDDDASIDDSIPDDCHLASGFELTTAGTLVGSPGYMAPEQWSSHAVDGRTDVYACGVLLYQLVTGRLPFEDENPFMVAARQLKEEPVPPHNLCSDVPGSLSAIILRALRPAPEARYQSAAEMRDALCAHLVERTIASTLGFGATLPLDVMSPLAGKTLMLDALPASPGKTLPLPDEWAPTQPMPILLPEAPSAAAPEMLLAREAGPSVARNGRKTPLPLPPRARVTSDRPSAPRAGSMALATSRTRVVLPLVAAFLALGVALSILLFFPAL